MARSALLLGLAAVLGSCVVGYLAYSASRSNTLRTLAESHLSVARIVGNQAILGLSSPIDTEDRRLALERMRAAFAEGSNGGRFLCVLEAPGRVLLHTAMPEMENKILPAVALDHLPGQPATLEELFAAPQDWAGRSNLGSEMLGGFIYLHELDAVVGVHSPLEGVERRLRATALPWGLGIALVALILGPLAFGLLYRSYRFERDAALRELAARQQAETRYRDLYDSYHDLYEHTPIMLHSIDSEGCLVAVNQHWLDKLGYRRNEVLGNPVADLLTEESKQVFYEKAWPEFVAKGRVENIPYQMIARDGRILDILLSATGSRDAEGNITHSRAMLADVTDLRRAEIEREAVIRELERANTELERFAYAVSHDLKSPLVSIKGFLGFLLEDAKKGDFERLQADADRISNAADRMAELLENLLALSRAGRTVSTPQEVDLGEIAREAAELLDARLRERGVEMVIADELPRIECDRVRILQVFQNLIENAVKFLGDQTSPRIQIGNHLNPETGERQCYIRDNGIGLDDAAQDSIFQLFHKIDSHTGGNGIGLALVKRIVEVHGGKVWAESEGLGKGTTFYLFLPTTWNPSQSGVIDAETLRALRGNVDRRSRS